MRWDLTRIIDRIVSTGVDAQLWPSVLTDLCRTIDADGAVLVSTDTRFSGLPFAPETGPMLEEYFKNEWNTRDIRYKGLPALFARGYMTDDDFSNADQRTHSPYYQDLMAKHGYGSFVGIGFMAGNDFWCVSIQRNIKRGQYTNEELHHLLSLWRPLSDAAAMSRQFGFSYAVGTTDALELLKYPAILLDNRRRVISLNAFC